MTSDEAKKLLPIIQAFAEGKKIQAKDFAGNWYSAEDFKFDMSASEYRIAPDPLEQAMDIYTETYNSSSSSTMYSDRKEALAAVLKAIKDGTIVL